jgi:hypothetical protein
MIERGVELVQLQGRTGRDDGKRGGITTQGEIVRQPQRAAFHRCRSGVGVPTVEGHAARTHDMQGGERRSGDGVVDRQVGADPRKQADVGRRHAVLHHRQRATAEAHGAGIHFDETGEAEIAGHVIRLHGVRRERHRMKLDVHILRDDAARGAEREHQIIAILRHLVAHPVLGRAHQRIHAGARPRPRRRKRLAAVSDRRTEQAAGRQPPSP